MIKQEEFYQAIKNNDIKNVKLLLSLQKVQPSYRCNYSIQIASENGHANIVELLLNDKRANPSFGSLDLAAENGHLNVVKLLLNDPRVDPTYDQNMSIVFANQNNHTHIVELLWNDRRIKKTLRKYNQELYNILIKKDNIIKNIKFF